MQERWTPRIKEKKKKSQMNTTLRLCDSAGAQQGFLSLIRQASLIIFQSSTLRHAGRDIAALSDS